MAIHILTECPRFLEDRRVKLSNRIVDTMALKDIRLKQMKTPLGGLMCKTKIKVTQPEILPIYYLNI